MKTIKTIFAILSVTLLISLTGCIGDAFEFDKLSTRIQAISRWNLPVTYGSLSVNELIDQLDSASATAIIKRDTIIIRIEDQLVSQDASDIVSMNDKTYSETFTATDFFNAGGFSNNQALLTKSDSQYPFDDLNALIIDRAFMGHTDLTINVSSYVVHQGFLTVRFPQITHLGQPFSYTIELQGEFNNITRNIALDNYEIDYSKQFSPGTKFIEYRLTLLDNGSGTFPADNQVQVTVMFNNNTYKMLRGYIGQFVFQMNNSRIKLGNTGIIANGTAEVGNPRLFVRVINSFGIAVRFGFVELFAKKPNSDSTIAVTGGTMYDTNPIILRKPSLVGYPNITPIDTVLYPINQSNSNLGLVLGSFPQFISYSSRFQVNPDNATDSSSFLLSNSKLKVRLTLEIPLYLRTEGLTFLDTLPFSLNLDSTMWNWIQKIKLKIEVSNGFPHNVGIQGIITDDNHVPIDSLFPGENIPMIIKSGIIDPNTGRINQQTGKTKNTTTVEITGNRINRIKQATKIIIFGHYSTTANPSTPQNLVVYYDNYSMDVKITADLEISIKEHL